MKTFLFFLLAFFSVSFLKQTHFAKSVTAVSNVSAIYEEFKEENGVVWRYVYDDDGSLIFKEKVFE